MTKASAISVRIDDTLKSEAESIFQQLGLTTSQAILLFYRQVTLQNGLPFAVRLPDKADGQAIADIPTPVRSSTRGKYAHLANNEVSHTTQTVKQRQLGAGKWKGNIWMADDFDELPEDVLNLFTGEEDNNTCSYLW